MITRRGFLGWLGGLAAGGAALGCYAFAIEPGFRLNIVRYALTPPRWTPGLKLRVVVLADPHCAEPWMSLSRWKRIIDTANELAPNMHLLLGDYLASHRFVRQQVRIEDVAEAALGLTSPLGTHSIMGNHDWWQDEEASHNRKPKPRIQSVFEDAGLNVLDNSAVRLVHGGKPFWLSGSNSMVALRYTATQSFLSRADIGKAMGQVTDDAPIIHLAHEPDLFPEIPDRVSLTLSGHTHGGQVRLFGYSPVTPSSFGNRFAYGHVVENGRHLIVSGGLGCSMVPVRFGMPPEIVVLDLG